MTPASSLTDKTVEKHFVGIADNAFKKQVLPGLSCAKRCGNMYTASLYGGLASIIANVEPQHLVNKRLGMYAFGGGCSGSFYAISVKGNTAEIREKMDLINRLQSMKVISCQEYVEAMKLREINHNSHPFVPQGSLGNLWPGAYYLKGIDSRYRRTYGIVSL